MSSSLGLLAVAEYGSAGVFCFVAAQFHLSLMANFGPDFLEPRTVRLG